LQDRLYEAGYHRITNVDISTVVIAQMNKVKAERGYTEMLFEVQDVRRLPYADASFDFALDKSTIDSLMCTDNPLTNVASMLDEAYRVLAPGGTYFVLSYGSPATRLEHLNREHVSWEVEKKEISRLNAEGEKLVHFLYICKKLPLPQERATKEWRDAYFAKLR
jgi:ubiquinone/menaquinone biosynthesis C-methylase UbiE